MGMLFFLLSYPMLTHYNRASLCRFFLGGVLSILAGVLVKYFLDAENGYAFPTNYLMIFGCGAVFMTVGIGCFCLVREPEGKPTYVGITNTVLGIGSLYPILGGALADLVHLQGVFALSAVTVFVGIWLSFFLDAPDSEN